MSSGSDAVPMDTVRLSTTGRTEHAEHTGPGNLRRESVVGTTVAHQVYMNESPRYLITGVVLGALGFLVAVIPFFIRIFEHLIRNESVPLEEVPPTVSEMVSKWETAEARIFFGFELSASLVIMLSWYPYKLQNVCCLPFYGGCHANLLCCRPSYATFRQFGPTLGLLLVSCCPTVPMEHTELVDYVLVAVHGFAAILMFCSFLTCEAHSLSLWPFKCVAPDEYKPNVEERERHFRIWTWRVAFFGFCGFLILQGILSFIEKHEAPCAISFWLEVTAGLSMLSNHSVVWYYCKERERRDLRAPPSAARQGLLEILHRMRGSFSGSRRGSREPRGRTFLQNLPEEDLLEDRSSGSFWSRMRFALRGPQPDPASRYEADSGCLTTCPLPEMQDPVAGGEFGPEAVQSHVDEGAIEMSFQPRRPPAREVA